MAIISRLGVVLGLDSAEFNAGLGKAEGKLTGFKSSAGAAGLALGALGAVISVSVVDALKYADSVNDMAKANEASVQSVLRLSEALSVSGGKEEDVTKILSTFNKKLVEAAEDSGDARENFQKLGVTTKDLATLNREELFEKTINGLRTMTDRTKALALSTEMLSRGFRGTNIDGFADELSKNKDKFKDTAENIKKIGDAFDNLDRAMRGMKLDIATGLMDALKKVSEWAKNDPMIRKLMLGEGTKGASLYDLTFKGGNFDQTKNPFPEPPKTQETDDSRLEVLAQSKAKAEALQKQYEKQKEALQQNTREMVLQTNELITQKSEYQKTLLEFEKGGKYDMIKDAKLKDRILFEAKIKDAVVEQVEQNRILYELSVAQTKEAYAKWKAGENANKALEVAVRRSEYEKELVNLSDTQREKALAFFDLKERMLDQMRQEVGLTDEQIAKMQELNQEKILADEATKRSANTFQAGWNRAYENFAERARDSASIGAHAFESMASSMESALDTFVRTGKLSFSDLINSMISDILRMMLKAQASSIFGSIFGGGEGFGSFLTSSSTNFGNGGGLLGFLGFADGGEPPVGVPSIVGERGAELFVPKTAGTIVPNHSLSQALGSQPQTVYNGTVVQHMSAIDTQSAVQFLSKNKQAVWSANQSAQRSLPMSRG